jgi:DNA-binding MarR family transcriptional regulator
LRWGTLAGDLAGRLSVSASVVSRTISSLEHNGLVERRQDPDDARAWRIGLSELGRRRIEEQHQEYVSILSSALSDWEPDEVAAATRAWCGSTRSSPGRREVLEAMTGLMAALFTALLSTTIVATALPTINADLDGT